MAKRIIIDLLTEEKEIGFFISRLNNILRLLGPGAYSLVVEPLEVEAEDGEEDQD